MRYDDIHPTIRAYLGGFQGLRKLGFRSDDIFVSFARSCVTGKVSCFLALRTQGKTFDMEAGIVGSGDGLKGEIEQFVTAYQTALRAVQAGKVPEADYQRIWEESNCCQYIPDFLASLLAAGFVFPYKQN